MGGGILRVAMVGASYPGVIIEYSKQVFFFLFGRYGGSTLRSANKTVPNRLILNPAIAAFCQETRNNSLFQKPCFSFGIFCTLIQIPPPKRANPGSYKAPFGSNNLMSVPQITIPVISGRLVLSRDPGSPKQVFSSLIGRYGWSPLRSANKTAPNRLILNPAIAAFCQETRNNSVFQKPCFSFVIFCDLILFSPIPFWSTKRENANPILIHLKTSSTQ